MEHLHLALHILLALSLADCYHVGTGAVCETAPVFPGYNLAGEGFDIVTLKRKGAYLIDMRTFMTANNSCHLFINNVQGYKLQKLPLSAVDPRGFTTCDSSVYQTSQSSVSKVVSALANQDSRDWKFDLRLENYGNVEFGGTRSDQYKYASRIVRGDKFVFSIHQSTCTHYRYRVSDSPPLSQEFKNDVSRLPSYYSSSTKYQYRRLIDTYGTHYIREASLGGQLRRLSAVRFCLASLKGFTSYEAHSCLSLGFNVGLGKTQSSSSHRKCIDFLQSSEMHLHHTKLVGGNGWTGEFSLLHDDSRGYKSWLQSLKDHPNVVQYSLRLMSDLVSDSGKQSNVKTAIEDYLKENSVSKQDDYSCGTDCCPSDTWRGYLTVTIVQAWRLKGDHVGLTESYAKMWYGSDYRRTWMIRSNYPEWDATYYLGKVNTLDRLRIEVWDEDVQYDDLLISCTHDPKQGTHSFDCYGIGGVEVRYTLTCDKHLTGDYCTTYRPTP